MEIKINRSFRPITAAVAVSILLLGVVSPAHAEGAFSTTATPPGCTTGNYAGYSVSLLNNGIWYARAQTQFKGAICVNGASGARAIGGSNVSAWQYFNNNVTVDVVKSSTDATPFGNHSVDGNVRRDT